MNLNSCPVPVESVQSPVTSGFTFFCLRRCPDPPPPHPTGRGGAFGLSTSPLAVNFSPVSAKTAKSRLTGRASIDCPRWCDQFEVSCPEPPVHSPFLPLSVCVQSFVNNVSGVFFSCSRRYSPLLLLFVSRFFDVFLCCYFCYCCCFQVFHLQVPHDVPAGGRVEGTIAVKRQKENVRLVRLSIFISRLLVR